MLWQHMLHISAKGNRQKSVTVKEIKMNGTIEYENVKA